MRTVPDDIYQIMKEMSYEASAYADVEIEIMHIYCVGFEVYRVEWRLEAKMPDGRTAWRELSSQVDAIDVMSDNFRGNTLKTWKEMFSFWIGAQVNYYK